MNDDEAYFLHVRERLNDELDEKDKRIAELEAKVKKLRGELKARQWYDVHNDALAQLEEIYGEKMDVYEGMPGFVSDMLLDLHQRAGQVRKLEAEIKSLTGHRYDPCIYCGAALADVAVGPCPATRDILADEINRLRSLDEALHENCTLAEGHPTLKLLDEARVENKRLTIYLADKEME